MRYFALCLAFMAVTLGSAAQNRQGSLKVMSYNIHIANPPSKPGLIDIDGIAAVIRSKNPDIVALQEVDRNTRRSGNIDQAAVLAKKLGMRHFFAKAIDHNGGEYGVAILSKFPIKNPVIHRLTTIQGSGGEPRVMTTARIKAKAGFRLLFAASHMDAQGNDQNRNIQASEVDSILSQAELPVILAGDLNAEPGSTAIRKLDKNFARTCSDCPPTFPVVSPRVVIDHIAIRKDSPLRVMSHEVVPEHYASDHLPVVATFQYTH